MFPSLFDSPVRHVFQVSSFVVLVALCSAADNLSALLQDREALEATVWREEVLAQEHEEYFIALWDALRSDANTIDVFAKTAFGTLSWPQAVESRELDHGVTIADGLPESGSLSHQAWLSLLSELREAGYELYQSEWHHKKFDADQADGAHSVVSFTLHILHASTDRRFTLDGLLDVHWEAERDASAGMFLPQAIEVISVEVQSRQGAPFFQRAGSFDIAPGRRGPVLAYDLNHDGAPELIMPGASLVAWNDGQGDFELKYLTEAPITNARAAVLGDFNGDGHVDLVLDGSVRLTGSYQPAVGQFLFAGDGEGQFTDAPVQITVEPAFEVLGDTTLTSADVDGDGDLDLWLGQYKAPYLEGAMPTPFFDSNDGNPSYLLLNAGDGTRFTEATVAAGIDDKRFRRVYSASLVDYDSDGDPDLLNVCDFSGVDLYRNDGQGRFTEVTAEAIDNRFLFGMAHSFADVNYDGRLDFYAIGMSSTTASRLHAMGAVPEDFADLTNMRIPMTFGNRLYVGQSDGTFMQPDFSPAIARTGWAWGVVSVDFDNDGDIDYYVANGHDSNTTAKDYCTSYWTDDIYRGESEGSDLMQDYFGLKIDEKEARGISWNGFEHNFLMMPMRDGQVRNLSFLGGVALEHDSRMVLAEDLNMDGRLDLVVDHNPPDWDAHTDGNFLSVFYNNIPETGNYLGLAFQRQAGGIELNGTKILVKFAGRQSISHIVDGDSFESQHSLNRHFGLGESEAVEEVIITWSDGRERRVTDPAINRYHRVTAPARLP